jgi:hypothetical protein
MEYAPKDLAFIITLHLDNTPFDFNFRLTKGDNLKESIRIHSNLYSIPAHFEHHLYSVILSLLKAVLEQDAPQNSISRSHGSGEDDQSINDNIKQLAMKYKKYTRRYYEEDAEVFHSHSQLLSLFSHTY